MFYGSGRMPDSAGGNRNAPGQGGLRNRAERFDQMTKQEQLIEQKRREIEAKLATERQRKEMEALLAQQQQELSNALGESSSGVTSSTTRTSDNEKSSIPETKPSTFAFANDGSFMEQFKKLQEKAKEEVKVKDEPDSDEYGTPVARKPAFKIINPTITQASRTPIKSEYGSIDKRIYSPPPPPPPPALEENKQTQPSPRRTQQRSSTVYQACPPPPPPPPPPVIQTPSVAAAWQPSPPVRAFALAVAIGGDEVEEMARNTKSEDPLMWFLYRPDSKEYQYYRDLVIQIRNEKSFNPVPPPQRDYENDLSPAEMSQLRSSSSLDVDMRSINQSQLKRSGGSGNSSEEDDRDGSKKKRSSRWGPQSAAAVPPPGLASPVVVPPQILSQGGMAPGLAQVAFGNPSGLPAFSQGPSSSMGIRPGAGPLLTRVTRTNPQLLSYARQSYGTVDLDEEQWRQCEEAYKMNLLFQDIARKKAKDEQRAQSGKFKHDYDSDEEIDDEGTWEHKQRMKEMAKTKDWAVELTEQAKGKHHIGDFLPPEELNKFMNKYKAVKEGRQMDESAYQDFKIAQDNVGFKLLQKMGWSDGQGLGASGQGITAPIDKAGAVNDKQGLGVEKPSDISQEDDEYTAYRKRMMLAYRFRPNPLNNPRRAYY